MAPPTWSVGQVLSAADVDNWFVPLVAYKTTALGRSGTTRTNDPDLSVSLAANCVYEVRMQLMFWSATAGNGFVWGFNYPASSDGSWGAAYNLSGTGYAFEGHAFTDTITCGTPAGTNQSCLVLGAIIVSSTSGNLTVSWSANGGATTNLNKGSYLIARRIT